MDEPRDDDPRSQPPADEPQPAAPDGVVRVSVVLGQERTVRATLAGRGDQP